MTKDTIVTALMFGALLLAMLIFSPNREILQGVPNVVLEAVSTGLLGLGMGLRFPNSKRVLTFLFLMASSGIVLDPLLIFLSDTPREQRAHWMFFYIAGNIALFACSLLAYALGEKLHKRLG